MQRLKELRNKRHISQVRLAMELSMSQHSISRYETGSREADYIGVSIDYLLGRTDNPKVAR